METKKILRIVLSSPRDVADERAIMTEVVDELNRGIAKDRNLRLELTLWEKDAQPGFHPDGPQGIIDPILDIQNCDILIGVFWKRFGTPTKDALSGTEHEFRTAVASWQQSRQPQIMMYFKEMDANLKTAGEHEQFALVLRFKEEFPRQGLYWTFQSDRDFERLVRQHLTNYIINNPAFAKEGQSPVALSPNRDQELIRSHWRKLQQHFSTIRLFGGSDYKKASSVAEQMTDINRGFIPLHLQERQDEAHHQKNQQLHFYDVFFDDGAPRHLLLRGLPGSGKTTLLRHLVHRFAGRSLAEKVEYIPVYMRLKSLDLGATSLQNFIQNQINADSDSKEIYELLCAGERFLEKNMILLFDGLDEIEHSETSQNFAAELTRLMQQYPRCKIIITSRPIALQQQDFPQFRYLDVLPLETAMIRDYLHKWFADAPNKVTTLLQTFEQKPRIEELAANPFLLSMICFTYEQGGDTKLIERRSTLYDNCTRYLLRRPYDTDSAAKFPEDYDKTLATLKDISWRFFLWQEADFPVDHVKVMEQRVLSAQAVGKPETFLNRVQRETGLIQRTSEGFTFVHRSLWEYFTALALLDKKSEFVIRHAANPDWEEVVRLYAGLLSNSENVAALVKGLWNINRPLALRVTTEVQTPAADLIKPLITTETGNQSKLLLIDSLAQSLPLIPAGERKKLVQETLHILLINCEERDCEVIYHAHELLEKMDMNPLRPDGLIYRLFDLQNAVKRQKELLDDPANHFEWIDVEGGTFLMGDDEHEDDEKPAHQVKVDSFRMAKHPATNYLLSSFPFGKKYEDKDKNIPATGNTWYEAYYFALWIGGKLPTEAEWEYAARDGKHAQRTQYYFGDNTEELANHAWFGESGRSFAHAVDGVNPRTGEENINQLGLANMLGNVWEWCQDWYSSDYYKTSPLNNPQGPESGTNRVVRGGSWSNVVGLVRCANRNSDYPSGTFNNLGFRCIQDVM